MKFALAIIGMMVALPIAHAEFNQGIVNTIWWEAAIPEKSYFLDRHSVGGNANTLPILTITGRAAEAVYKIGAQHGPEVQREQCLTQICTTVEYDGWTCAQLLGPNSFNSGVNLVATAVTSPVIKILTGGTVDGIGNAYDRFFCYREIR